MAGFELTHKFESTKPVWAAVLNDQNWGFARISTTDKTLNFEFIDNEGAGVLDQFTLSL